MISVLAKVKDTSGNPLEGVNISMFKNESKGTTTNDSGEFFFEDINPTDLIVFSYQGQEVILEAGKILNEVIIDTVNVLDEVVVTSKSKSSLLPYFLGGAVLLMAGIVVASEETPKKITL